MGYFAVCQYVLSLVQSCFTNFPTNCEPWSVSNCLGTPVGLKISIILSATVSALTSLNPMASGNLLARHIAERTYLYPFLDLGKGQTISNAIFSNGSVITGICCKGALGTFVFLVFWHLSHCLHQPKTSL